MTIRQLFGVIAGMRPLSEGTSPQTASASSVRRRLAGALTWMLFSSCLLGVASAAANDLVVGKPAPPMTLTALDGTRVATSDLRGKVVIVTFWATWCVPCREELPLLSRYAQKHAHDGLVVLGFSLDTPDTLAEVRRLSATLNFPVGLLGDPHVPGYGRIWRLPVSFTIDRNGLLQDNGWTDASPVWTAGRLERVVTPLLGQAR